MNTVTSQPIVITSAGRTSEALLHLRNLTLRERKIRAAKIWGMMWLCSLASIPVSGLHIVAVPAFFLAGPIMAYLRYRVTNLPDHVAGSCPACKVIFTVPLAKGDHLPTCVPCPSCSATLELLDRRDPSPTTLPATEKA